VSVRVVARVIDFGPLLSACVRSKNRASEGFCAESHKKVLKAELELRDAASEERR
jgi:hypothetical protein